MPSLWMTRVCVAAVCLGGLGLAATSPARGQAPVQDAAPPAASAQQAPPAGSAEQVPAQQAPGQVVPTPGNTIPESAAPGLLAPGVDGAAPPGADLGGGAFDYGARNPDLFYNYYVPPMYGGVGAAMYPAPRPTPPIVGHVFYTYQPFMPHEHLYQHYRAYYNYSSGPYVVQRKFHWLAPHHPANFVSSVEYQPYVENKTTVLWGGPIRTYNTAGRLPVPKSHHRPVFNHH